MEHSKINQENSSILSDGIDIGEALRIEVEQLKRDLAYRRSVLAALKEEKSHKGTANPFHSSEFENLNSIVDLNADLHRFAGMYCVKLGKACVFQFSTGHKVTKKDIYAVEILKTDGRQRLGRWVMPMSIDLHDLVLEYPLENPKNIKPFLKCCKHHIDCYSSRRNQYYHLKDFLSDAKNCFLDTTLGYLQVHLHMSGIKMIDSEKVYNICLYMGYDSNRAIPTRMATELREGKLLPPEVAPHFSKYFKPFKRYNLQEAFKKVISDTQFFQWTKVSYDYDEFTLFTDGEHNKREHDVEESGELDETETSRKLYKKKGKGRSKKKDVENDLKHDWTMSERKSIGEKSLSSEEKEERSKPNRNTKKARASKRANDEARKKSKRISNSKVTNVNIKKYLTNKIKSIAEENSDAVGEKVTTEKSKEDSKERENSKEREKEKESLIEKEKKDKQIDGTDNTINPSGDANNDNVEIPNDESDKISDEVEKNVSLSKTTPLSRSSDQIKTNLAGKSKKGKGVKKNSSRKSNISNISTKSATNVDVARNDKELTMAPTNVYRSNFISSTPISNKVEAKLCTSQYSEISEISGNGKLKKDHTTIEQDILHEEISEKGAASSSISDDIGEENAYEEAKELLKDLQVFNTNEAMKNNTQRKIKKTRKKRKGKVA